MQFRVFNRVWTIYLRRSGKDFSFNFRSTQLEKNVIGINSNLDSYDIYDERAKHTVLLDYDDNLTLQELIEECKRLQEKFSQYIGDAYIFESSPNKYHVHFYQPVTYWKAFEIIHFSKCDDQYKKWRGCRNNMTLRVSPKENGFIPKFIMIVPSRYFHKEDLFFKRDVVNLLSYEMRLKNDKS